MYTLPLREAWQRLAGPSPRSPLLPASLLLALLVLPGSLPGQEPQPSPSVAELTDVLRNRLEATFVVGDVTVAGRSLMAVRALSDFYDARDFQPAWTGDSASNEALNSLRGALDGAPEDGLVPRDYHLATLDSLMAALPGNAEDELRRRVDLELLLTDAFLVLGSHLLHGRVDPETVNPEWTANRRNTDMAAVLRRALESDGIAATLEGLRPPDSRYTRLRDTLARYRELARAGGWPTVPPGPKLELGADDPRVTDLRRRLRESDDLQPPTSAAEAVGPEDPQIFDEELEGAVRRFQRRHGLNADGVVGPVTLAALNVPVESRIRQLEVNLERWRWLPREMGRRHIEVNIAGFSADVMENGRSVLELRAVVGQAYRQTPTFTGQMTYLVFSPYWHVPPGIAAKDKVPALKERGPAYLREQRMTLLEQRTDRPVDPASVDWAAITAGEFNRRYRIRQEPGSWNALGGVKFMFPNKYSVYLHDTPTRELFDQARRSFSSGCIRVERPAELAAYLLSGDPEWSPERIREAMGRDRELTVRLAEPVPVHVLYWTAWADRDGLVHFREDIYDRDATVARALTISPEEN